MHEWVLSINTNENENTPRHTWFDRDLSVAGRVMIQQDDGCYRHTLVKVDR